MRPARLRDQKGKRGTRAGEFPTRTARIIYTMHAMLFRRTGEPGGSYIDMYI